MTLSDEEIQSIVPISPAKDTTFLIAQVNVRQSHESTTLSRQLSIHSDTAYYDVLSIDDEEEFETPRDSVDGVSRLETEDDFISARETMHTPSHSRRSSSTISVRQHGHESTATVRRVYDEEVDITDYTPGDLEDMVDAQVRRTNAVKEVPLPFESSRFWHTPKRSSRSTESPSSDRRYQARLSDLITMLPNRRTSNESASQVILERDLIELLKFPSETSIVTAPTKRLTQPRLSDLSYDRFIMTPERRGTMREQKRYQALHHKFVFYFALGFLLPPIWLIASFTSLVPSSRPDLGNDEEKYYTAAWRWKMASRFMVLGFCMIVVICGPTAFSLWRAQ